MHTDCYKPHVQLDTLKLGWCKVGPAGAQALFDLVMYNQTISALDLRGNALGNDGAIILGRGLRAMVGAGCRRCGTCAQDDGDAALVRRMLEMRHLCAGCWRCDTCAQDVGDATLVLSVTVGL